MLNFVAKIKIMGVNVGQLVKQVMIEKRMKVGDLAKKVGYHIGSMSRVFGYEHISTSLLVRISVAMEYDFFSHFSEDLKMAGKEKEKSDGEKMLEECKKENEVLKNEVGYLKRINELMGR